MKKMIRISVMKSILILMLCTFSQLVQAQSQYKLYAGFMYHFVKYTQWPSADNEVVLGILGKTALNTEAAVLNGKMAGSMKITVKEISNIADINSCKILFIPSAMAAKYPEIVSKAKQHHVLVISDSPGAVKSGVVINFFEEQNNVKFEISNKNAADYGLKIAGDLQKIAKVID